MTVRLLFLFNVKSCLFCRPMCFITQNVQNFNFSTLDLWHKQFARFLSFAHGCTRVSSKHDLYCYYIPSKCVCLKEKLHFSLIGSNFRLYNRWARCSSSKILVKQNSGKHHRCRSEQSSKHVRSSLQLRSDTLKETKKKVAEKMEELKENVVTIPNALCLTRMAMTPFLGYLVLQEFYVTSLGIFVFAGCTDVIDGYIARTFPNQQSMIGSFLDPAADKLLIATLFLSLTANGLIPVPLTSLIIFRDACLMTAGFYIRYVSLPPPKTLVRYFDVSFATARLSPTGISKINTLIQLSLVAVSLAAPVFGYVDHLCLKFLWYVTGASTVLSAGSYLYCRNTYKLLMKKSKNLQRKLEKI